MKIVDFVTLDILIFYEKPKLKLGQKITEIIADNGHHKYATNVFVKKIKKVKGEYKVYVGQ